MKRVQSKTLLNGLQQDIRKVLLKISELKQVPPAKLMRQPAPGKWSVAQIMEHLNFYCRYYITAIENGFHLHETKPSPFFKHGWLGEYFTNLMKPLPDHNIGRKMKAPKNAIPSGQPDATAMLQEFEHNQHHLLHLLKIAESVNLNAIRIPISLSKLIRLKLGDTFCFVVAHEQRHFVQIENALN